MVFKVLDRGQSETVHYEYTLNYSVGKTRSQKNKHVDYINGCDLPIFLSLSMFEYIHISYYNKNNDISH